MVGIAPAQRILADLAEHQRARQQKPRKKPAQIAFPAVFVIAGKGVSQQFFGKEITDNAPQQKPQRNPNNGISFPQHLGGNQRIFRISKDGGVNAHGNIGVMAEIGKVHRHNGRFQQSAEPAHQFLDIRSLVPKGVHRQIQPQRNGNGARQAEIKFGADIKRSPQFMVMLRRQRAAIYIQKNHAEQPKHCPVAQHKQEIGLNPAGYDQFFHTASQKNRYIYFIKLGRGRKKRN